MIALSCIVINFSIKWGRWGTKLLIRYQQLHCCRLCKRFRIMRIVKLRYHLDRTINIMREIKVEKLWIF